VESIRNPKWLVCTGHKDEAKYLSEDSKKYTREER